MSTANLYLVRVDKNTTPYLKIPWSVTHSGHIRPRNTHAGLRGGGDYTAVHKACVNVL